MITYNREKITVQLLEEVRDLLIKHEEELNVTNFPLDINELKYIKGSIDETAVAYIARDDGKLIGYLCYFLYDHPHYNVKVANQDVLYLDKNFRRGRTGLNLVIFSEEHLRENLDVELVIQSSKLHKSIASMFKYLGYKETDVIYIKEL